MSKVFVEPLPSSHRTITTAILSLLVVFLTVTDHGYVPAFCIGFAKMFVICKSDFLLGGKRRSKSLIPDVFIQSYALTAMVCLIFAMTF